MASRILLINGSPNKNGCTYTALKEIADTLDRHGIGSEIYWVGKKPVSGCIACNSCREKNTGRCVIDDDVNVISDRLDGFRGIVLGSPVYYAGPSGQICAFTDRLFYFNEARLAGKLGASVVSCRRGGATAAFDRLNKYFTITNMIVVGSQYWNMVHGFTPEDVRKDHEGLQTMRTLGENMAYLCKALELAEANGVPKPAYEPRMWTHFIN